MISGLPESTLRYYEQIGIIAPHHSRPEFGASRLGPASRCQSRIHSNAAGVRIVQDTVLAG